MWSRLQYQTLITKQPKEKLLDIKIKKNDIYFHAFNHGGSDSPSLTCGACIFE